MRRIYFLGLLGVVAMSWWGCSNLAKRYPADVGIVGPRGEVILFYKLAIEVRSLLKDSIVFSSNRVLFATKKGIAMRQGNFVSRIFRGDIKESSVPLIRFHDLRHTALTLMVKRGIALPVIQAIAGHRDIRTTMKYVHVVGEDIDRVGAKTSLVSVPCQRSQLCLHKSHGS